MLAEIEHPAGDDGFDEKANQGRYEADHASQENHDRIAVDLRRRCLADEQKDDGQADQEGAQGGQAPMEPLASRPRVRNVASSALPPLRGSP